MEPTFVVIWCGQYRLFCAILFMAIDVLLFGFVCGKTILTELNRFFYVFLPVQSHINCNTTHYCSVFNKTIDKSKKLCYNFCVEEGIDSFKVVE